MRYAPPGYAEVLAAGTPAVWSRVSVWRNGRPLAGDLPIVTGSATGTTRGSVPDGLTFQVPRRHKGVDYLPGADPEHPLNTYGQVCHVLAGYARDNADPLVVDLGRYRLTSWDEADDSITVTADGMLSTLGAPNDLVYPIDAGSRSSAAVLRDVVGSRLPIVVEIADRLVPAGVVLEADRLAAAYSIADAWPARLTVDGTGVLRVRAPFDPTTPAVTSWTEGRLGTSRITGRGGDRSGVYNVWRILGESDSTTGRSPVLAVVYDAEPTSPTWVGSYGEAVASFASPFIATAGQAEAIGQARLRSSRSNLKPVTLEAVPDHRIELDDVALYTDLGGDVARLRITDYALPIGAPGVATYTGVRL